MPSAYLPLHKSTFIFLFHENGERELWPVLEKPNGFGNYQQAFDWLQRHPEVPENAGVADVYIRG